MTCSSRYDHFARVELGEGIAGKLPGARGDLVIWAYS